jgi:2-amino-4-hydroxy-6-hydroxymethyldihydropteridine diphosphokinase
VSLTRVYLSLGSNIDPVTHLTLGVRALAYAFGPLTLSPVYRNPAVGFVGDDFLNLVVGLDTALAPLAVAQRCRDIEAAHGRERDVPKFSSRTLDIDLLTYGDAVLQIGRLVLPRDEIIRYAFVLQPLADLAADECHPGTGESYRTLWRRLRAEWGCPQMTRVAIDLPHD